MGIGQRAVSASLLTLLLVLVFTALASCGGAGATGGKLCTVYEVYLTDIRYDPDVPASQVKGQLLLTKADVDPTRVLVMPHPQPVPAYSGEYVVQVWYTKAAVERAERALPNPDNQITLTWVFGGKVVQSGYQLGVNRFDQVGPFPSQSQAQHFATALTSSGCQGNQ